MTSTRVLRRLAGSTAVLVLVPALAAMLASAASVPHVHVGAGPGLFNHDHDLGLLATLSSAALLPDVIAAAMLRPVASPLLKLATGRLAVAPQRHADPRAPPLR